MNFKHFAAAILAAAIAATQSPAAAQQRAGGLQVVRGSAVETFTEKPGGALPTIVRGKFPREPEPAPAARSSWIMSGGGEGAWFYNATAGRLIHCWRQNSVYVGEYRVACVRRNLSLH